MAERDNEAVGSLGHEAGAVKDSLPKSKFSKRDAAQLDRIADKYVKGFRN